MLKLPKGLKKKKKGKKSKKKDQELFTEEELEQYRREHQQQEEKTGEPAKENEEWSKFKDLTTGIDTALKKTTSDLDRIKSTSFFQRVAPKKPDPPLPKPQSCRPVVEVTAADFPQLAAADISAEDGHSSCAATDDESDEEDDRDDIFDTSYVEAVERGEIKLAEVPDSPTEFQDDDIFDTSHVDVLIKGPEPKTPKKEGKKAVDIGLAVGVLTGRIDNVKVATTKRKRVVPGDLLLESTERDGISDSVVSEPEPVQTSILDIDADIPITSPVDLSVSLHTSLIQQCKKNCQGDSSLEQELVSEAQKEKEEIDEFTLLATESLETSAEIIKVDKEIRLEPIIQESWSAFEANKSNTIFAECIVEDQIDVVDPYLDQDDPFDTTFADAAILVTEQQQVKKNAVISNDDDDFDPRSEEVQIILNNRRKSSVRIHLTAPSGLRESITSDEREVEESKLSLDLLGGSTTDLTQLDDSPLDPVDINKTGIDPFDTTIFDKIVAPGRVELKILEQELTKATPASVPVFRVPSDPDFDPRADEKEETDRGERRASRPENLVVSKSVVFNVDGKELDAELKIKQTKPVTPYYIREVSITDDLTEENEADDTVPSLIRTRSHENLTSKPSYHTKRRHSEYLGGNCPAVCDADLLHGTSADLPVKVLTPSVPKRPPLSHRQLAPDPFDTSAVGDIVPSKTELRLLAKEFSCEKVTVPSEERDLLEPHDDIFQAKALTPEPSDAVWVPQEDYDPFDTSFASDLNPGRTELQLLESEFLK